MPDTYSLKKNAVRAAKKALADGTAPAPTYEIKTASGGGFRIVWDTVEPKPEPPRQEAEPVEAAKPPKAGPQLDAIDRFIDRGIADLEAADLEKAAPTDAELTREFAGELARNPQSALTKGERERLREVAADVPKAETQLAKVTDLLKRAEGATIAEIQAATGWLPHTTRAFVSTKFRGRVTTDKVEGRGRVYRVAA